MMMMMMMMCQCPVHYLCMYLSSDPLCITSEPLPSLCLIPLYLLSVLVESFEVTLTKEGDDRFFLLACAQFPFLDY